MAKVLSAADSSVVSRFFPRWGLWIEVGANVLVARV